MGRPFQITAASETVRLDTNGQGELAFTVSNVSGGSLRGRGKLVHQDPASQAWVNLSVEQEQDFAVGATRQFPVKVKIPPASKAGRYTFRLLVVDVQNTDENYAEGPTIQFEVKQVAQKKPFPWLIVVIAGAALLIICGVVLYFVLRSKPAQKSTSAPKQGSSSSSSSPSSGGQPSRPQKK